MSNRKNKLNKILSEIVTILDDLIPAQHSDYWYRMRKFRVGASEIATIIGLYKTKYANIEKTLQNKIMGNTGRKFLCSNASWGTIFETEIRRLCEYQYKTVIHETGSIPSSAHQAMSPDGLGVVAVDEDGRIDYKIALFEYKCPSGRNLNLGQMPEYYIPQVLIGLETISICSFGIFIEAIIRRAPLYINGHTGYYDFGFPRSRAYKKTIEHPIAWGAISVKVRKKIGKHGQNSFNNVMDEYKKGIIDFGSCPNELVDCMLEAVSEGFLEIEYLYRQYYDDGEDDYYNKEQILQMCEGDNVIGVMRWKMTEYNEVIVHGRPYLAATSKYAELVNECVAKCDNADSEMAKLHLIKQTAKDIDSIVQLDEDIKIIESFAVRK